jgi:hypothetical protein
VGQYHTRQRRGDRVLEMVWLVVGWGPRRKGSRMGWEMRSEDHRVRRYRKWCFPTVVDANFYWME